MTPEQLALRDTVRSLLDKHSDIRAAIEAPHGYDKDLWARLCEIGVLPIPEHHGGSGAGLAETLVALEELGRTLTPAPLLSSTLAAQALLVSGNDEACGRLLPRIAGGTVAALALPWATGDHVTTAPLDHPEVTTAVSDGPLHATVHHVLDGDHAEILLVTDGISLYEVDPGQPGVTREHTPAVDLTRRLATIRLTDATATRLGLWSSQVRDTALAALCAEQVGAAARALELTVEYTKTRVQFGRPIGSFQALKHRMADMHVLVETARSAARAATDEVSAAVAKVYCAEAFCKVAAEMIQLHGGIAITWEHDAHLYFKRAHGSAQLFGSPQDHIDRLSRSAHR
ncbi:alkylation response protein AidB-like acyl-CoA dehydrogenase [Lentzea atacamensis]|uniref:Alkylation response protein AidB-like acyl-CoA dehydrogenase n=1 Tax=Lentzea atacamensis TaxID=531938 RepID=A0ABX9EG91_9PSEU|nr:acyl-CoA dehydrogenase family protein [Lentzea atacamensis]RAS70206.1 alkylation response protein AidB-like acyl-CoA dehydrogenase [Lentzea atacamensis]